MKKQLIGAFDLAFLFGRGIDAFSGKKQEAIRSIVIPVALLPLAVLQNVFYPPKGMEGGEYGALQISAYVLAHIILSFILMTALAAAVAQLLRKREKFWLYFEATNWTTLAFTMIILPLSAAAAFLPDMRESFDRIFVIIGSYSYIITACIAYRSFRLNWQLAGAFAIANFFISQELYKLLYGIQDIPLPW